jgi:hypothetical protein
MDDLRGVRLSACSQARSFLQIRHLPCLRCLVAGPWRR